MLEHEQRRALFRAITAIALSARHKADPLALVRRTWNGDRNAELLIKAARGPIMTGDITGVESVRSLVLLAPRSAAVRLFEAGVQIDLTGIARVRVPNVASAPSAHWVAEGQPAPFPNAALGSAFVGPARKILILSAVTAELEQSGAQNASAVIGQLLSAAATRLIDATAFGTAPDNGIQPAGLLAGVTPTAPTSIAGQMTPALAAAADLGNMAQAMANANIDPEGSIIVAAVKQAVTLRMFANPGFQIFGSTGLAAGTVVLAQPAAIASALDGVPEVETGEGSAVVHMADPASPIVDGGAMAAPTTSLFQQDMLGIKCRAKCAWTVTAPGGIQVANNVAW